MKLRLDPWATEYDTAFHADAGEEGTRPTITPDLELSRWRPIRPAPAADPGVDCLLFLDGSRRSEARVLLEDERRQVAFGALGSFGVGVVDCCSRRSRRARFLDLDECVQVAGVERLCTLSSGRSLPDFEVVPKLRRTLGRLSYRVVTTDKTEAEDVMRELQFAMLRAEAKLAARLTDAFPHALVVTDGPRPRMGSAPRVVGYVKTIHALPLSQDHLDAVRELEEGQRSPIYLRTDHDLSQQTFEWFLRLRDPRPWLYSFAGMVRLQADAGSQPEARLPEVQRLADWLAITLPHYATRAHQDPRAPQQLLPVRALESELRRRMGHPQVVRRRIMQHLQEQG
jgi:uncharacterized protein